MVERFLDEAFILALMAVLFIFIFRYEFTLVLEGVGIVYAVFFTEKIFEKLFDHIFDFGGEE